MLREFFVNENPRFLFKQWGLIHNIFTITTVVILMIIYFHRNKFSKFKNKEVVLKISTIILLINMLIYTFGNLYYGSFNYKEMLPFHLCFIANYMFIVAILLKKYNLLKYTFFMSFIGPIPAILWPDLISTIDNFNFWQLIISHHFFICVSLYSYYALNYHIEFKDLFKLFIFLNLLLIIFIPFNYIFDTNYIFTNYIPQNVIDLYPWLTNFPPYLVLEVLGLSIASLIYIFLVKPRNKIT